MSPNPHLPIPVAAACAGTYTYAAASHPLSAISLVTGVGVGFYFGGVMLALAVIAMSFATTRWLARSQRFRRAVDLAQARKRVLQRRHGWRQRIEQETALSRDELTELIARVEEIERSAPEMAQRFEVEGLVDAWIRITIAHERCIAMLRAIKRDELVSRLMVVRQRETAAAAVRCDILERRIAAWDECRRRADRMADELAAIVELVRLLAQRAAQNDAPEELENLRHALIQLGDEDDALQALACAAG